MKWWGALILTGVIGVAALGFAVGQGVSGSHKASARTRVVRSVPTETVYIRNAAPRYFSDKAIRRDIPAWTKAANRDFAPVWRTPHVRIVLLGRREAPRGGIVATFKQKGPISGALAFHGSHAGVPYIVVYSGVTQYYGYSPSLAFTHELFEMLADHFVSGFNIGYLTQSYYVGTDAYPMPKWAPWFNEVCDPVEKYTYKRDGVRISDFITPNWFNDPVSKTGYDYLGLVQYPFQVLKGGYAQFVIDGSVTVVQDFKGAGRDADGYLKGEGLEHAHD